MKLLLFTLLLLALPLTGVWLAGLPVDRYLEFPPRTAYVDHATFSWPIFIAGAAIQVLLMGSLFSRISGFKSQVSLAGQASFRFPVWGYWGLGLMAASWLLAWTRFPWFAPFQPHTFTPLWLSYIIGVNALTFRRAGRCLLTHEPGYLLKLFPLSAAFWWFFEYLNRFVQNWFYVGSDHYSPMEYFLLATVSFSTVLPAVISTEECLRVHGLCEETHRGVRASASDAPTVRSRPYVGASLSPSRSASAKRGAKPAIAALSAIGLLLLGVFPNVLFPFVWLTPACLILAVSSLEPGTWNPKRYALAALICGFFWEMWNFYSLSKWIYEIPYVGGFKIFEMPVLGWFGYLPFGCVCGLIAACLRRAPGPILKS